MCDFQGKVIKDIATSALVSWSLILGEASHHVMKKLKPHYVEARVERHCGLPPTAVQACHLGNGSLQAPDDSISVWHLNCNLMRDLEPELPS